MVTKTFEVEQLAPEYQEREDDGTRFMDDIPIADVSLVPAAILTTVKIIGLSKLSLKSGTLLPWKVK